MRNFAAVPSQQYIGAPYPRPVNYGDRAGIGVPLRFDWISYGASTAAPNLTVNVDLRQKNVAARLIAIRSIYIDNMGSSTPIYVYFPDTQYSVVCQPNAAGWYKVYTNELLFWVVGLGFLTGSIPTTYIIATNLTVESAVDLEIQTAVALNKASSTISRGNTIYNQDLGVPALGDQTVQFILDLAAGATSVNVLPILAAGFYYLTFIEVNLYSIGIVGATSAVNFFLESTGISGVLYSWQLNFSASFAYQNISRLPGNIKIDALQQWRLRQSGVSTAGKIGLIMNFTSNPN